MTPVKGELNRRLESNIAVIHDLRRDSDQARQIAHVIVDFFTSVAGSIKSIYAHVFIYSLWIALVVTSANWGIFSKENLEVCATLEAIILSLFVLVNQKRARVVERRNSDLGLQVGLLAEVELTKIAKALDRLRTDLGFSASDEDLEDIKSELNPKKVIEKIKEHEEERPTKLTES